MSIRKQLHLRFQTAMTAAGIADNFGPAISLSKKAQFGDFQANGAMAAAKSMKCNPREIAASIIEHIEIDDIADKLDIAGPGFINIHLKPEWLANNLQQQCHAAGLGIEKPQPETIVVDYSSPNLAKEMHVGHLRSTIIGDAIVRVLEFLGHTVIRQNHVGDWGTQFGMLLTVLESHIKQGNTDTLNLADLEGFYRQAKKHFDEPGEFADKARDYVVKLQAGDSELLALWQQFRALSLAHSQALYDRLNVTLSNGDVRGESAYNDDLPVVVDDLIKQQIATKENGTTVIFLNELLGRDDQPSAVIIQKKEGGYLYATTDLAALRYRKQTLAPSRILYFIDARQSLHMKQIFMIAHKAGYVDDSVSLEHHAFGTMMGKDGKPFKTRDGELIKLQDLLNEAIERAETIARMNQELSQEQYKIIAQKVGIGAVKYFDLSKTRTQDYVFDWEDMLSLSGNTGPYLQYAYARIQRLFRKAGVDGKTITGSVQLSDVVEKQLAIQLLQFGDTVEAVSIDAYPHLLCTYLYELASLLMRFYEACPVLKEDVSEATKESRLLLLRYTSETLSTGLDLLGIDVMDEM